jgi:uncharacterized membrane protein YozB (DUF420 family)
LLDLPVWVWVALVAWLLVGVISVTKLFETNGRLDKVFTFILAPYFIVQTVVAACILYVVFFALYKRKGLR